MDAVFAVGVENIKNVVQTDGWESGYHHLGRNQLSPQNTFECKP